MYCEKGKCSSVPSSDWTLRKMQKFEMTQNLILRKLTKKQWFFLLNSNFNFITSLAPRIFCFIMTTLQNYRRLYILLINDLLQRHIDRAMLHTRNSKVERVPRWCFRKWYVRLLPGSPGTGAPPTTYHLLFSNTSTVSTGMMIRRARPSKWYATGHLPPWSPTTTYYLIQVTAMQYDDKKSSFY